MGGEIEVQDSSAIVSYDEEPKFRFFIGSVQSGSHIAREFPGTIRLPLHDTKQFGAQAFGAQHAAAARLLNRLEVLMTTIALLIVDFWNSKMEKYSIFRS